KKFADDFKKNGKDVVQAMLDKGFDFSEIVDGFGLTVSDMFNIWDKDFLKKIQATFDKNFTESLSDWAEKSDIALAEIFGKNMQQYLNQYKYQQKVKSGETKPNSDWDAQLYNGGKGYYPSRFATGGYISSGNRAIVAEAGPELLEVMNGGIRVTPLRGKSVGETVSGSESSPKNFYNTYNINNPRISGYNDVRTIAQELASEQRRIERGRGL
ncbi:MAG: hypothetical protein K2J47_07345, partial [Ruminococcus sp.]|nr:hypothetical protein [Ruminococcus sp.]